MDSQTGKVVSGPEIHARGFAEDDGTFDEIKDPIIDALDKAVSEGVDDSLPAAADHQARRRTLGQRHASAGGR